ncbi:hypothetical protein [Saccharopolyspora phatthalungensis]|uniref:Sugar phosphate isomerase/epimerase n=1 Tax=Saccharopolyspora phatthalungensis TaxID=664693 RepID=A0A840Q881_9PSEU|nr:hypothetical protein [Saccharopolyspora phatthalungensis]MBB5152993.1 sugar phosphate isomerase/epimerase [Saccharopolyspora phatthalungensis]
MSGIGCSTISFRHRPLADALSAIVRLGPLGIDLGGLPGACDHLPMPLDGHADDVVRVLDQHELRTGRSTSMRAP